MKCRSHRFKVRQNDCAFISATAISGAGNRWLLCCWRTVKEGLAGATVFRGVAGFGAHARIHTAAILDLSTDPPLVIQVIDTPEKSSTPWKQSRQWCVKG